MASPTVDVSSGITIVFGTSSFSAEIVDVRMPGTERGSIETTHQGTSPKWKTFTPEDFADPGSLEFDVHFNPDTALPTLDVAETVTITWPSGATFAATMFVTSYGNIDAALNGKMMASLTLKISGEPTIVAAS